MKSRSTPQPVGPAELAVEMAARRAVVYATLKQEHDHLARNATNIAAIERMAYLRKRLERMEAWG